MALNVNIIGRDSEGNLRALKVNSEGNLDFGQLETEIQAVKDNQGRLYGKHGEVWIPVKVDSEGRPIIASDVTVTADGLIIDLGQIKQGPAGTEPWPVQLSGTDYEVITLANAVAIATDQLLRYRGNGTFAPGTLGDGVSIEGWNKYNFHALDIINTHDVEVTLTFQITRLTGFGFSTIGDEIQIPPGNVYNAIHIPYTSQGIFEGKLSSNASASLRCVTVPTTGSITIKLIMWN